MEWGGEKAGMGGERKGKGNLASTVISKERSQVK